MRFVARLTGGHRVAVEARNEEEAAIAIAEQYPGDPGCPGPDILEFIEGEDEGENADQGMEWPNPVVQTSSDRLTAQPAPKKRKKPESFPVEL